MCQWQDSSFSYWIIPLCVCILIHTYVCMCVYTHMHIHMHMCKHIYICMYVCMYTHVCVCTYMCVYSYIYIWDSFLIHLFVDRHSGCFHVLATVLSWPKSSFSFFQRHRKSWMNFLASLVNNAALNMGVHISLWEYFHFLEHSPRSGFRGAYGSSIFNVLRSRSAVFLSDCTSL